MSYSRIVVIGNLGNDPEMQFTPQGRAICTFNLAHNRVWRDQRTQEKKQETTWFRVTVADQKAEQCHERLKKGSQVMVVSNRIKLTTYTNKQQEPRVTLDLLASDIVFPEASGGSRSDYRTVDEVWDL